MFGRLHPRSIFVIGGIIASLVLVIAGAATVVVGWQGRDEVRSMLRDEQIIGPADSRIPGQLVDTGDEAKAQADIIREHQLTATGGLTYAQMGRYALPPDANGVSDPKGTNNADEALKNANGQPVTNALRDRWVTVTALSTALNTSYFAEQVALFSMLMGGVLILTGAGFGVLTLGALRYKPAEEEERGSAPAAKPTLTPQA
jgi:hypothetical protein